MREYSPALILSDARGQYIPRDWAIEWAHAFGPDYYNGDAWTVAPEGRARWERWHNAVAYLRNGPEGDWYWEEWDYVLVSAVGRDAVEGYGPSPFAGWRLYQGGDVWVYDPDGLTPWEEVG